METKISTVGWQQPLALNHSPIIFDIPYQNVDIYPVLQDIQSNKSFLHSPKLKESIFESKRAFLNHSLSDEKPEDEQMEDKPLLGAQLDSKRVPCKKISFKIKKQSSLYKRNVALPRVTNIPINKVAELTKKFNEMVENRHFWEEQRVQMLVKRGDSVCSETQDKAKKPSVNVVHKDSVKVCRKPSVKTKPALESKNLVIIKTTRKSSIKKQNSDKLSIRAKFQDKPEIIRKPDEQASRPTTLNLHPNIPKAIIETSPNGTSVRAAIEIFEKKSVFSSPTKSEAKDFTKQTSKPVIPEKSSVIKNLAKTSTLPSSYRVPTAAKDIPNITETIEDDETTKKDVSTSAITKNSQEDLTEFQEDSVEIINIPAILPQRRCDSMYETLNMKKINPQSLKAISVDNISAEKVSVLPNTSFLWRDKSPSSTSSRSSINTQFQERLSNENSKKLPPDIPPKPAVEPFKPRPSAKVIKKKMPLPHSPEVPRKREVENDDLADYEEIGCIINDVPEEIVILNEEKFKSYDEITKPANEFEIADSSTQEKVYEVVKKITTVIRTSDVLEDDKHYEEIVREEKLYEELSNMSTKMDDGYEPIGNKLEEVTTYEEYSSPKTENIYETLPVPPVPLRRQQQEPLPPRPPSSTRNEETVYNCYESIYTKKDGYYESIYGSQLTTDSGSNRDSVLSSDHKSNSLYGHSLLPWDYNSDNTYYKPPSDVSDRVSDRSDEWEDVTDNEERENTIIVVREKAKGRKSGWSQHFREQLSKTLKESNSQAGKCLFPYPQKLTARRRVPNDTKNVWFT